MAVEFMTIPEVRTAKEGGERVEATLSNLSQVNTLEGLIEHVIANLEVQIEKLQRQESIFLSVFKNCNNINDFKNQFREYYNSSNLINFTGKSLYPIIQEYKAIMAKDKQEYVQMLNTMLYNLANNVQLGLSQDARNAFRDQKVTTAIKEEIIGLLLQHLSTFKGEGSRGSLTSTKFAKINPSNDTNNYGSLSIAASLINDSFIKRLEKMKKEARRRPNTGFKTQPEIDQILLAKDLLKGYSSIKQSGQWQFQSEFIIDWTGIIQQLTKEGTGKGTDFNGTAEQLEKANTYIMTSILQQLNLPSQLYGYAEDKIRETLRKDKFMFFNGKSETQITGLLGEINTVIALIHLMGDKYTPQILSWVGGQHTTTSSGKSGPLPSVDIILKDIAGLDFGIQVKNTTIDLKDEFLHEIAFASGNLSTILSKLQINDTDLINVLTANTFNVPYKIQGTSYQQKSGSTSFEHGGTFKNGTYDEYLDLDKAIDDIVEKINVYFALYAPDFLYMGLQQDNFQSKLAILDNQITGQVGGNFVYVVGSEVFFASEMLTQLQNDLNELKNLSKKAEQIGFQLRTEISLLDDDIGNTYNIVSVLNGRGTALSKHSIKLQSAWKFKRNK